MKTKYDRDYFIAKFEAIPEELWSVKSYGTGGKHCAHGHCGQYSEESVALAMLWETDEFESIPETISVAINDGEDRRYQQPTPKQRILAALRDLPSSC